MQHSSLASGFAFSCAWTLLLCAAAPTQAAPATGPTTNVAKPTAVTEVCANDTCHAGIMDRKVLHGPVAQKKCLACHAYAEPRDHHFRLASDPAKLCGDCHTIKVRTVLHAPVKQGNCSGCHDPHGSNFKSMLRSDPTRGLCLTCHKQQFDQKKYVHGPVATGACIVCHEAHTSWEPKLLVKPVSQLCTECHNEATPKKGEERHVHAPVKDNCVGCHDAHASDFKKQLRQGMPELCFSCHKELAKTIAASPVVHKGAIQPGGCAGCHAPHFSQLPKLQKQSQPDSCLSCHDKPLATADGKTLTNMAALLKENPQHHGPIREGACTACHAPHAGERFRLLTADYPAQFYAPFQMEQYKLCFTCHIPDMVQKRDGVGLTRFRNGDLNLHWLHVNQTKGRTCRACHEVHASQRPFHIRESVPFGDKGWMLEINYQQSATGGSCLPGCHKAQTYDHGGSPRLETVRPTTAPSAPALPLMPATQETKNAPAVQ